jgi:hypothetical protein
MRSILLASVAVAFSSLAAAQPAEPTFSPERVRAHVEFLADDALEGRNAGERGYDVAARYVASQFRALGLQPAVNGDWYQMVPFQESSLAATGAKLTIDDRAFANGSDVLMGPSAFEPNQSLAADVVFVGYGMQSPERGIDDYAGLDVRGKVVAILSGFPKGMPSDIGAHLSSEKSRVAHKNGAIGVVSILTPTALKVASWERRVSYLGEPSLTWIDTDGRPYTETPGLRFTASLNRPASEALFGGARRSLAQVIAESEKQGGRPKGFALKPRVQFERASASRRLSSPNVVAMLPGSDPALRDEYVLLMGHLDHDGVDPKKQGDQIYNGALDNAAGIATMLEAARAMANAPTRPKRSILFAAVTAEEDGLLGAEYLAKHPVVGAGKVVGVVNLDMPVLLYDFTDVIAFGAEHSTLGPIVERAAGRDGVKLSPDPIPEEGIFTRSDHYRFVREGVPSVFLVTGYSNGGDKINADFLANHYHKVSDSLDLPINWNAGAKFARINYLIAREIADAPQAPRWFEGSFFGNLFAADQPKAPKPAP